MENITAAAVIIGNEVLSAKVSEQNGAWLIRRLREKGIGLRLVTMVPDEIDLIVEAVLTARKRASFLITSGGIGPTHDDVTVRAVAMALSRSVTRLPEMEKLVRQFYPDSMPTEAMRLAEAPEGSRLIAQEGLGFPVLACEGIYMLPGVPQLFRMQLEAVLSGFPDRTVFVRALKLNAHESDIAHVLDALAMAMPDVEIGSYPTVDASAGYRVKVTVEHTTKERVDFVVSQLQAQLPENVLLSVE